ncbi:hypothetical protein NE234_32610 [Actinoallomurus sp. WRP9H-5]|nr:hypothetical protein [Actinoallomurus rhizosphaericola]MCO5998128.1 hypothetical protein [Actinoallomurus rhizosphaericola]
MRRRLTWDCPTHLDPYDCPDAVVVYVPKFREYGLIVHDGGRSSIVIDFCPWCGSRLPESRRDRWFDELEREGIDPWADEVPAEYEDGRRLEG